MSSSFRVAMYSNAELGVPSARMGIVLSFIAIR
jgi:hypothetical protein